MRLRVGLLLWSLWLGLSTCLSAQAPANSQATQEKPAPLPPEEQELVRLAQKGNQAQIQGDFAAAEEAYQIGLAKAQALHADLRIAQFLGNLGLVYYRLGQYNKSLDFQQRALTLKEKLGNQQAIAYSFNNLGNVYEKLGQFDKSLDFQQRALTIREKLGNVEEISASLNNLGMVYSNLCQFDKALDYFQRSLVMSEKLGNVQDIAGSFNNLGIVYDQLLQFDKALDYYQRALTLKEKLGNQQDIAYTLHNLGFCYYRLGQFDKSLEFQQRALTLQEKLGNVQEIAHNFNTLGIVYFRKGQFDKALDFLQRALTIHEQLGNEKNIADALANLGLLYVAQGKQTLAEQSYAHALQLYEAVSSQVSDASQLGAFQETTQNLYARYAALLLQEHHSEQALAMQERGRGQGLARQFRQNQTALASVFSPAERAERAKRLNELDIASSQLHTVQSQPLPADAAGQEVAQKRSQEATLRYASAQNRLTTLETSLRLRHPEYARLTGAAPPTAAQLLTLARNHPNTLFVEWAIVDDETTLLLTLSAAGVRAFPLPVGQKKLASLVYSWRADLLNSFRPKEAPQGDSLSPAKALYAVLFGPLEQAGLLSAGKFQRLVFVADGPLQDVPFATLLDSNGKPLIERFALSSALSLGTLLWPNTRPLSSHLMLCAADPTGKGGEKIASASRGGFAPLPAARQEGREVTRLFPNSVGYVGEQATKTTLKREMPKYALLHFATHAQANNLDGLRSCLVLAPDVNADGFLEAREIMELPLSAKLAFLSACETAKGQQNGYDGLLGLVWAFRAAGCPCVIASQWKVSDEATKLLVIVFYKALKAGKPKDEALRAAMLAARKTYPEPRFWAAFQVIGNAEPLPLELRQAARTTF